MPAGDVSNESESVLTNSFLEKNYSTSSRVGIDSVIPVFDIVRKITFDAKSNAY